MLQYLHEDSHVSILHMDIKASNIFLNVIFQPHIGDFGFVRFYPEDQAYLSTATLHPNAPTFRLVKVVHHTFYGFDSQTIKSPTLVVNDVIPFLNALAIMEQILIILSSWRSHFLDFFNILSYLTF